MKLKMFQSSSKALIFPTIFPLLSLPTVRKFSVVVSFLTQNSCSYCTIYKGNHHALMGPLLNDGVSGISPLVSKLYCIILGPF